MAHKGEVNRGLMFLLIIAAIGVGCVILCINIFKPKANINAPYKDVYSIINDVNFIENTSALTKIHDSIIEIKEDSETELSISNIATTYDNFLNTIENINSSYEKINNYVLLNIQYTDEATLIENQKALSTAASKFTKEIEDCNNYIKNNIKKLYTPTISNVSDFLNKVGNYFNLYKKAMLTLADSYFYVGNIFKTNVLETFNANDYMKQTVFSITTWAKICMIKTCDNYLTPLYDCSLSLINFYTTNFLENPASYYDNTSLISLTEKINNADMFILITKVCEGTVNEYINGLEDEETKTEYDYICDNYLCKVGGSI